STPNVNQRFCSGNIKKGAASANTMHSRLMVVKRRRKTSLSPARSQVATEDQLVARLRPNDSSVERNVLEFWESHPSLMTVNRRSRQTRPRKRTPKSHFLDRPEMRKLQLATQRVIRRKH